MKILVRLPNWLGDVVMSIAFLKALRLCYHDAFIHVIIKSELGAIAGLLPEVDEIHLFKKSDFKGLFGLYQYGSSLKHEKYDLFFSLPDSFSSALIGYATGAKKRTGFKGDLRSFLLTDVKTKPAKHHRVEEYLALLPNQKSSKTFKPDTFLKQPDVQKTNLLLLNFNSEASSRRMPLHKAKQVLDAVLTHFPDFDIGLIGSAKESFFVSQIIGESQNKRIINFSNKTSLTELANLIASAKAMLSTDSGPAHLANSLKTPVLVLFGAGNEKNTAPYNQPYLLGLRLGKLSCEPCKKNTCKFGDTRCLGLLPEQDIIAAFKKLVNHD